MVMRPGTYLAKRRAAAGLSIEDVALRIATTPPLPVRDRVEWLKRIEDDVDPVTIGVANALHGVFPFSPRVLVGLANLHSGESTREAPRLCESCACSELDACLDARGRGCSWAGPATCSFCAAASEAAA